MFDFASDQRQEGDTPGRNDKGLVTYDRKIRKDSFYFYKASWSTTPVVYITSRRYTPRKTAVTEVKIYSNAPLVELIVNGVPFGAMHGTERIFRWPGVQLKTGENQIEARADFAGHTVSDHCNWIVE